MMPAGNEWIFLLRTIFKSKFQFNFILILLSFILLFFILFIPFFPFQPFDWNEELLRRNVGRVFGLFSFRRKSPHLESDPCHSRSSSSPLFQSKYCSSRLVPGLSYKFGWKEELMMHFFPHSQNSFYLEHASNQLVVRVIVMKVLVLRFRLIFPKWWGFKKVGKCVHRLIHTVNALLPIPRIDVLLQVWNILNKS